jgi:ABC-type polysaccharide/polyol phosphate transport system ATPase subunit
MSVEVRQVTKEFPTDDGPVRAIDEVGLDAPAGSAMAIVGPNGAGKSTLLRLVAGILVPTRGTIRRASRCSSLIELSAGFHPDLTARENLDLGLALAGFSRNDQRLRRPRAIEFSGLGDAMDLPVKHLSNGMVARLGCSLAVHSEPEVLLIDEVLAVGDGAFQREMLNGVARLVDGGTTLMLVSHSLDLAAVATSRTLWLDNGRVVEDGPTDEVLTRYEDSIRGWGRSLASREVRIERLALDSSRIEPGGALRMRADLECTVESSDIEVHLEARPVVGESAGWMRSKDETLEVRHVNLVACTAPIRISGLTRGTHRLDIDLPAVPISPSQLELSLLITDGHQNLVDELSCDLELGRHAHRPHFHLEASPANSQGTAAGATAVDPTG